jgi:hypothetical protein
VLTTEAADWTETNGVRGFHDVNCSRLGGCDA